MPRVAGTSIPLSKERRDALRQYCFASQAKLGRSFTYDDAIAEFLSMVGWAGKKHGDKTHR